MEWLSTIQSPAMSSDSCQQIKRQIVDGAMELGEIPIVLNNFSMRAGEFTRTERCIRLPCKLFLLEL
jgi:hypothetical protein